MTSLLHDLRFAFRTFRKRPGFTLMVVLILGLGLGTTTAVVDLTNLLAWRQVPVERSEELVKVFTASHSTSTGPATRAPTTSSWAWWRASISTVRATAASRCSTSRRPSATVRA